MTSPSFHGIPLEQISALDEEYTYGEGHHPPQPRYHFLNGAICQYAEEHGLGLIPAMLEMQEKELLEEEGDG